MEERRKLNNEMREDIKLILKILNGNGTPGLVAQVAEHDKHITTMVRFNTFILTTFIGALIIGVVGFIIWKVGLKPG